MPGPFVRRAHQQETPRHTKEEDKGGLPAVKVTMLESLCPRCGAYWSCRCKRSDAAMRIRVSLRATAADAGVDAGALARKIAADMGRSVDQVFPLDTLRDEEEQP